jgi:hypothetical protein
MCIEDWNKKMDRLINDHQNNIISDEQYEQGFEALVGQLQVTTEF